MPLNGCPDRVREPRPIVFDRDHDVPAALNDVTRDVLLAAHRIGRDQGLGEFDRLQQQGGGRDLVGLLLRGHPTRRDPVRAGPRALDGQRAEPVCRVVRPSAGLAVNGDPAGRTGAAGFQGLGNPSLEAPPKPLGLKGDEHPADAIAGGEALGEREEPREPVPAMGRPPVDGGRTVAPAHEPANGNHHDVEEQVLAIAGVTRINEGREVGADGFDARQLCRHVPHRVRRAAPPPERRSGNTVRPPRLKL